MNAHLSAHMARRLLPAAAMLTASSVLAQVPPPGKRDGHSNEYRYPVMVHEEPTVLVPTAPVPAVADSTASIQRKLQSIIIPRVEFNRTPLGEAVEYLRRECRRLDPEPDPAERGVNIMVKFPTPALPVSEPAIPGLPEGAESLPEPTPSILVNRQTPVSLSMDKPSLLEALTHVALKVGMKIKARPEAVYMVTPDSPLLIEMDTVTYQVSLDQPDGSDDLKLSVVKEKTPIPEGTVHRGWGGTKSWLESKGIKFPPGAWAGYFSSVHQLTIHNTRENLDKIAAMISALQTPAPTPSNP